ncbi:grasp-with-spasm system ATP-grasp peptide maturase [Taibaiella koreensis]|uniref:grasp-with-spasm system ATP-grasp peptide maturase n=1 Tax=Taibaiella koreensis TaxID=1268548 RepID=UPI000E59FF26|nr:grasp-with-spasm system ATP-grasp peptide maturase [Taibaiella koreensis]
MVLILSEHQDASTVEVLKWLNHFGITWIRINEDDEVRFDCLEFAGNQLAGLVITINGKPLNLVEVKSYWYRRGWLHYGAQYISGKISNHSLVNENMHQYLQEELDNVMEFVHRYLQSEKQCINSYLSAKNNKTYYHYVASKAGFDLPDTLIATQKKDLERFSDESGRGSLITKSINEMFSFTHDGKCYRNLTNEVRQSDIQEGNKVFYPTLFQTYVEKFFELRVFYILGEIYSMAIFSQLNAKTQFDFRNYDHEYSNRNVPFILPASIAQKVKVFMAEIDLNCGSLDMIVTADGRFVFLEVNPVGQFGMVSNPCNYYLEKRIAEILSQ